MAAIPYQCLCVWFTVYLSLYRDMAFVFTCLPKDGQQYVLRHKHEGIYTDDVYSGRECMHRLRRVLIAPYIIKRSWVIVMIAGYRWDNNAGTYRR